MEGRTVVITGGNSGIGLETAVALAGAGARVVLGCRDAGRADAAVADIASRSGNDAVGHRRLDLADLPSVRAFAADLADLDRVDVLINNAGLILGERRETAQGFEATFGTNHLGHFLLTGLLSEQLRASGSARVVNVASMAHLWAWRGMSWGDLDRHHRYNGWQAYGESKLANILHARALAARFEGTGVVAHSLHPGSVHTRFGKDGDTSGATAWLMQFTEWTLIGAEDGARTTVHVATSDEAGRTSGTYWANARAARPSPVARDDAEAERLWCVSERMVAAAS
jgi:NAD(P)-dependent dehydrogenase (short-subunit alcohol dehydrogenase family)